MKVLMYKGIDVGGVVKPHAVIFDNDGLHETNIAAQLDGVIVDTVIHNRIAHIISIGDPFDDGQDFSLRLFLVNDKGVVCKSKIVAGSGSVSASIAVGDFGDVFVCNGRKVISLNKDLSFVSEFQSRIGSKICCNIGNSILMYDGHIAELYGSTGNLIHSREIGSGFVFCRSSCGKKIIYFNEISKDVGYVDQQLEASVIANASEINNSVRIKEIEVGVVAVLDELPNGPPYYIRIAFVNMKTRSCVYKTHEAHSIPHYGFDSSCRGAMYVSAIDYAVRIKKLNIDGVDMYQKSDGTMTALEAYTPISAEIIGDSCFDSLRSTLNDISSVTPGIGGSMHLVSKFGNVIREIAVGGGVNSVIEFSFGYWAVSEGSVKVFNKSMLYMGSFDFNSGDDDSLVFLNEITDNKTVCYTVGVGSQKKVYIANFMSGNVICSQSVPTNSGDILYCGGVGSFVFYDGLSGEFPVVTRYRGGEIIWSSRLFPSDRPLWIEGCVFVGGIEIVDDNVIVGGVAVYEGLIYFFVSSISRSYGVINKYRDCPVAKIFYSGEKSMSELFGDGSINYRYANGNHLFACSVYEGKPGDIGAFVAPSRCMGVAENIIPSEIPFLSIKLPSKDSASVMAKHFGIALTYQESGVISGYVTMGPAVVGAVDSEGDLPDLAAPGDGYVLLTTGSVAVRMDGEWSVSVPKNNTACQQPDGYAYAMIDGSWASGYYIDDDCMNIGRVDEVVGELPESPSIGYRCIGPNGGVFKYIGNSNWEEFALKLHDVCYVVSSSQKMICSQVIPGEMTTYIWSEFSGKEIDNAGVICGIFDGDMNPLWKPDLSIAYINLG